MNSWLGTIPVSASGLRPRKENRGRILRALAKSELFQADVTRRRYVLPKRYQDALQIRWRRLSARRKIPQYQLDLQEILKQHRKSGEIIIFPPGLGWRTHLFQRPQQLALALAAQGALVFYLEPELSNEPEGIHPLAERLYLCRVPVKTFQILEQPLVYVLTWNRKYADFLPDARLIYDFVDDLSAFDGPAARLKADHNWLLKQARLVSVTAEQLQAQVFAQRPDALLCPNGVDYDHFTRSRQTPKPTPPADLAALAVQASPIIGYYGALARWFDFNLLTKVSRQRPGYAFVLIGPDFDGSLSSSGLLQEPNVHWLGQKTYDQLPTYLAHFAVAVIPFLLAELTHAISPLKLFEYMAGGKPVVTTPLQESARYPGVLTAEGPGAFAARLDEALELSVDPAYLTQIEQVARANTWEVRAQQILTALKASAV
jgi:glycosyltransferase involved in cell wall biosynthesis